VYNNRELMASFGIKIGLHTDGKARLHEEPGTDNEGPVNDTLMNLMEVLN
jgi:hypothetical protein